MNAPVHWFAQHAERLADSGYDVTPISIVTDPVTAPGKQPRYRGWENGYRREHWPAFARYGVGILTRNTPALDIDVKCAELAEAIQECADDAAAGVIAPFVVPMDAAAEAADDALRAEHLKMKRKHEGSAFSSIIARFREQIRRVALIAAVADNPAQPVCTEAHVTWATALVRHCLQTMMAGAERFIADTEYEAQKKRVLDIIRRHGGWMDGHEVAKKLEFLERRRRVEILADLIEAGAI